MAEEKLDLLIKLLGMTSSSHDAEALLAARKANEHLAKLGWTWDRLLRGKVTIIADPFANLQAPPPPQPANMRAPAPPPPPRAYSPPPKPQPPPLPRPNGYPGHCYCCGTFVDATKGYIRMHGAKWECVCTGCHTQLEAGKIAMGARRAKKVQNVSSILDGIL